MSSSPVESSGSFKKADPWSELTTVVDHVRELTNSSGAAVALITNEAGKIDCRVRSGPAAPEIGASAVVEGSLTALCIRNQQQVFCDDLMIDQRGPVSDSTIRAVVITPICLGGRVKGVLVAFSNVPRGFSAEHRSDLSAAARQIAGILWSLALTPSVRIPDAEPKGA